MQGLSCYAFIVNFVSTGACSVLWVYQFVCIQAGRKKERNNEKRKRKAMNRQIQDNLWWVSVISSAYVN